MTDMTDTEFLGYCSSMTTTERCGFVPQTIARLLRLAGDDELAAKWEAMPNQIVDHIHYQVINLVERAELRLSKRDCSPP